MTVNDQSDNSRPWEEQGSSRQWDVDSAIGDDDNDDDHDMGSTQSLTSSILNYTYENGRRYHAFRAGQYFMPNDGDEQEAMTLGHHISLLLLGGELHRAPIKHPTSVLEIGTGIGLWAIDVADKYPAAAVIATDLSPIQPSWIPPNLEFQVDDCESPWDFNTSFDFIYMRNLDGAIADWPKLLNNCYNYMSSNGWIEIANMEAWSYSNNDSLPKDSATYKWQNYLKDAARKFGRELNLDLEPFVKQAGFVDIKDDVYQIPMSNWKQDQKELARYFQAFVEIELESLSLRLFTVILGWPVERLRVFLAEVFAELSNPAYEMYGVIHYVYGRKPAC